MFYIQTQTLPRLEQQQHITTYLRPIKNLGSLHKWFLDSSCAETVINATVRLWLCSCLCLIRIQDVMEMWLRLVYVVRNWHSVVLDLIHETKVRKGADAILCWYEILGHKFFLIPYISIWNWIGINFFFLGLWTGYLIVNIGRIRFVGLGCWNNCELSFHIANTMGSSILVNQNFYPNVF